MIFVIKCSRDFLQENLCMCQFQSITLSITAIDFKVKETFSRSEPVGPYSSVIIAFVGTEIAQ